MRSTRIVSLRYQWKTSLQWSLLCHLQSCRKYQSSSVADLRAKQREIMKKNYECIFAVISSVIWKITQILWIPASLFWMLIVAGTSTPHWQQNLKLHLLFDRHVTWRFWANVNLLHFMAGDPNLWKSGFRQSIEANFYNCKSTKEFSGFLGQELSSPSLDPGYVTPPAETELSEIQWLKKSCFSFCTCVRILLCAFHR